LRDAEEAADRAGRLQKIRDRTAEMVATMSRHLEKEGAR
jgi:hypothetical protein